MIAKGIPGYEAALPQDQAFVIRQLQITKDWACNTCHKTGNVMDICSRGVIVRDCMCNTVRKIKGKRKTLFDDSGMPNRYLDASPDKWQNMGRDDREKALNHATFNVVSSFCKRLPAMLKEGYSLFFVGPHGVGKTYLSCCIANTGIVYELDVKYCTIAGIVQMMIGGWRDDELAHTVSKFRDADLLIIDDVDKLYRTATGIEASLFDNLLRDRLQMAKSCIFTSNKTVDELMDHYGPAIVSMLHERCAELVVAGEDYRSKELEVVRRAILNNGN